MLTARDQQMVAFQAYVDRTVTAPRIKAGLRKRYPKRVKGLSDEKLTSMIVNGMARARRHGLTSLSAIFPFVELMFDVAPNFDEHPAAQACLRDESCEPNKRIALLNRRLTEAEWREAGDHYDWSAWGVEP
jgi:hypothetical protein